MQIWILTLLSLSVCFDFDSVCLPEDPPFPLFPQSQSEEFTFNDEVFVSWNSHKGAYHLVNSNDVVDIGKHGHISLLIYPTDLDACLQDCAILQRIDNTGKLQTPQIYLTKSHHLYVSLYGFGSGRIMSYDQNIQIHTWQKVTISLLKDRVLICVSSALKSHCITNKHVASVYEYSSSGVWVFGGSSHKKGMPGFIKDVTLYSAESHIGMKMDDLSFVNKPLKHIDPGMLPVSIDGLSFLCKATLVNNVPTISSLTETSFECANEGYQREDKCYTNLKRVVKSLVVKRVVMEAAHVMHHISPYVNCTADGPISWIKRKLSSRSVTDIKKTLDTLSTEVLYRRDMPCTTVVVALLSSCYGNLETLFKVGALLETGVTLPKRSELARVFTMAAAAQGSTLANLALASKAKSCPLKFAYHGVVGETFLKDWRSASSEDLVAVRTRLHHGDLGLQEGTDDQVYQYLLMQANQGDAEAQANVARMMYWGQGGVERNIDDAFEMQHAAAAQNHPDALFDTGVMMLKGHGTTKNATQARQYLEKAAKAGHKGAPGTLGYLEMNENNNITGAIHYFNQSHELGDTDSTHNLAIIQSFYKTFSPDPFFAHELFKLAAEKGHKDAAMVSAEQTLQGLNDKAGDCHSALKYIKMLSSQSSLVTKMMREAVLLFQDADYDRAALQYLILAEAGVEMAQYNLAWLCQEFSSELTLTIPNCTQHYYTMSALNNYGPCQAMVGNDLWASGNFYDSARWYARAANNNEVEGFYGLGFFSKQGIPVGVVSANGSRLYFGSQANVTLSYHLWYQCFQRSTTDAEMLGCGAPLVWLLLSTAPLKTVSLIVGPCISLVLLLACLFTRFSSP